MFFSKKSLVTNLAPFWTDFNSSPLKRDECFSVNVLSGGFGALDELCSVSGGDQQQVQSTNHQPD